MSEHAGGSDPLAELARLIGQDDPFAGLGRKAPRAAQRPINPPPLAPSDWHDAPAPDQHRYASRDADGAGGNIYGAGEDYADPRAKYERYDDSQYDEVRAAARLPREAPVQPARDAFGQPPRYDDQFDHDPGHEAAQAHDGHDYNRAHYHEDEAAIDPQEDDMYDDAPSSRRRGGLVTALALIGCAMMGTAGAYGYRSYYADAGVKAPAPVISADANMPNKIVPAGGGDQQANKSINERFANAAAGREQLVSRQEEPVALKEPGTPSAPRVVLPSPVAPAANIAPPQAVTPPQAAAPPPAASPPQAAPPAQPAAAAPAAGGSSGPKRVRTVTIRPDGSDASGRPVAVPPAHGAAVAPAPRAASPAPRASSRHQETPLSLDPQGQPIETGTAPAHPRVRSAVNAPAPRVAPEPAESSVGGSFVVQISSQSNERDARASFHSLQSKFPNELGGRQPIIRRADLGSKGVVYRTNVGPFASRQEAGQFCESYRAAGGQCVIPRN